MIEYAVYQLLSETAQETLASMFFISADAVSANAARPSGALISSALTFRGSPCGRFEALVSVPLARALTANFLGLEDASSLASGQVEEIMGELTNIVCGAVLSELQASSNFDISTPIALEIATGDPAPNFGAKDSVSCRLDLPEGSAVLHLAFEESA